MSERRLDARRKPLFCNNASRNAIGLQRPRVESHCFATIPRYGAGGKERLPGAVAWREDGDAENDLLRQRATRVATIYGKRVDVVCFVEAVADYAAGDGVRRVYRCLDADDGSAHAPGGAGVASPAPAA